MSNVVSLEPKKKKPRRAKTITGVSIRLGPHFCVHFEGNNMSVYMAPPENPNSVA